MIWDLRWLSITGEASSNSGFIGSRSNSDQQSQERLLHASTGCNQQGDTYDSCLLHNSYDDIVINQCMHVYQVTMLIDDQLLKRITLEQHRKGIKGQPLKCDTPKSSKLLTKFWSCSCRSCERCKKAKQYFRSTTNM